MTAKANHSMPATTCPTPLVLFGIDSRGKPKAARFRKEHAGLAVKAASQLALQVVAGNDPKVAEIAARLPVGRVHATGRAFVPFIRRDLYDQLLAAAGNGNLAQPPAPPASGASGNAAGSRPPGSSPKLPRNWQEIGVGDLVLAQWDPEDGWYDAICHRSCQRHVHVALVRLPAGTQACAPSAAAWVALSRAPTNSGEWEIRERRKPRKARQTSRGKSRHQRPVAAQELG
jgi:hypothetical protein